MSPDEHRFLFASLADKKPTTARQVHIRRLYDLLQLCLQRNDISRAKRAWAILARCKEVNWKIMWTTGVHLLGDDSYDLETNTPRVEFLRSMMLQYPEESELILQELVLRLTLSGQHRDALDQLELYLPSFPYQDNPVLHIYAGLICIYASQPLLRADDDSEQGATQPFDTILLRDAQAHLERARSLDPTSIVANAFLGKIPELMKPPRSKDDHDSDEDSLAFTVGSSSPPQKRARTAGPDIPAPP